MKFSLPMIVGNLFQQAYTIVDSAIVGHYNGEAALAAVGASSALTTIFICVAIGGGIGASVIISQHFGAKRFARMKSAVYTALLTFLAVSVLLAGVGLLCSEQIMTALKTPPDALEIAVTYLNIYFYGLPFLFLYNILSSLFNALGKIAHPADFLNFFLAAECRAGLVFRRRAAPGRARRSLCHVSGAGPVRRAVVRRVPAGAAAHPGALERSVPLRRAARHDARGPAVHPAAVHGLHRHDAGAVGGQWLRLRGAGRLLAAMRIESICVVPMTGIGNAVSSYTAQNMGARRNDRVILGYHAANKLVAACAVIICVGAGAFFTIRLSVCFWGKNGTATAVATGEGFLIFMGWFFCLIGFKMAVDGLLRGAGDMKMFTIANLVNLSIRVILAVTLAPRFGIAWVWYAVPVGWFANWVISYSHYRTGKWKTMRVNG